MKDPSATSAIFLRQRAFTPKPLDRTVVNGYERLLVDAVQSAYKETCEIAASVNRLPQCHGWSVKLAALRSIASAASAAKYIGTGASLISDPFPAVFGSVEPE